MLQDESLPSDLKLELMQIKSWVAQDYSANYQLGLNFISSISMSKTMNKILFSLSVFFLCVQLVSAQVDAERQALEDSGVALQEIISSFFSVSTNKTFHLIFPNEVKYFSIGD